MKTLMQIFMNTLTLTHNCGVRCFPAHLDNVVLPHRKNICAERTKLSIDVLRAKGLHVHIASATDHKFESLGYKLKLLMVLNYTKQVPVFLLTVLQRTK